tara:strand:- start:78 stop:581 length:504 start_codon:yes stop_codon:yes gene_type:complete
VIDSKILYLVSGEKEGMGFWEIGTTKYENPLNENNKFLECYRKEILGQNSASEIEEAISINISNIINLCKQDGFILQSSPIGYSFDLPLTLLEEIYDFWLEIYIYPELWDKCLRLLRFHSTKRLSNKFFIKGLIGNTAKYAAAIENLHSYRPESVKNKRINHDPMWI